MEIERERVMQLALQKKHWTIIGLIFGCCILLGIAVIGLHLDPWRQNTNSSAGDRISTVRGGYDTLILDTEFPKSPVSVPVYKIKSVDNVEWGIPEQAFTTKKSVPSVEEAPALAERGLEKFGGLPKDAKLVRPIPSYQYKYNLTTNAVEEKYPLGMQMIYHQEINGSEVRGAIINLQLGEGGEIIDILKIWPAYDYAGEVNIIPAEQAFEKLKRGETTAQMQGQILEGTKITKVKLAYETASDEVGSILKPIWMFSAKRPTPPLSEFNSNNFSLKVDATR